MNNEYYLSKNGTHVGPYTLEQILAKVETHENQWTDYVFDAKIGDWLMLIEHPEFSTKLSRKAPAIPVIKAPDLSAKASEVHDSDVEKLKDKEWFIMKDNTKCGPFCYLDLLSMLQKKSLAEFDFIWHAKLPTWKPVAEVEDFKPEAIRAIKELPEQEVSEIFFRRRHARANYGASLIIHNNKTVFRGKAIEIGAGGAGIIIDNPSLQTGQSLFLHFQPGQGVPPFNAVCEIVSKKFIDGGYLAGEKVSYGVKFTAVTQAVRESIAIYTSEKAA